jgi:hypothetical protein
MRQECFKDSTFINYVNENMVVIYGFVFNLKWDSDGKGFEVLKPRGKLVVDGETIECIESYNPAKPDKKVKKVVPFMEPYTAIEATELAKELLGKGVPKDSYVVFDSKFNVLVDYKTIETATAQDHSPTVFLDFFKQANRKMQESNDTQVKGANWRNGYWGCSQADYYRKGNDIDKMLSLLQDIFEDDQVPEKYQKEALAIMEKSSTKVQSFVGSLEKKLKDEKTKDEALEVLKLTYSMYKDDKNVMDAIKKVCKAAKISKKELIGEDEEEKGEDEDEG